MELKTAARRRHGAELKARVLSECDRPGASVAAIALAHGLNANLVHKWRRAARRLASQSPAAPAIGLAPFMALPLTAAPTLPEAAVLAPPEIRIELRRAALAVNVRWPVAAADQCAALLRELLR